MEVTMTIAQLIEAAAGKFGEHVKTVIFSYVVGAEYRQEIKKMIGQDVCWPEARDALDVPLDSRDLPLIRADTEKWTWIANNEGNGWRIISRFPRPRAR
jgi:hypothetical protein